MSSQFYSEWRAIPEYAIAAKRRRFCADGNAMYAAAR